MEIFQGHQCADERVAVSTGQRGTWTLGAASRPVGEIDGANNRPTEETLQEMMGCNRRVAELSNKTKELSDELCKTGKIYPSAARRRGLWQGREARFIRLQPPRPTGWSKEREQRTKRRSDTDRAVEGRTKRCCGNPELSPPPRGAKARAWGGKMTTEKRVGAAARKCLLAKVAPLRPPFLGPRWSHTHLPSNSD